jgi:hypothetical protein
MRVANEMRLDGQAPPRTGAETLMQLPCSRVFGSVVIGINALADEVAGERASK